MLSCREAIADWLRHEGGTTLRTASARALRFLVFNILTVVCPFLILAVGSAAGQSYVYDSLGRLVTVYDSSGDAAVYSYDAVGNLLSITNSSSSTFAALDMSSNSGTPGSTLTISGTDFLAGGCTTPTVTINGVAATVTSATATQIVVTVPSNA